MRLRLTEIWDKVNTSYWFVPSLMALGSVVLALTMVTIDRGAPTGLIRQLDWVYGGGPEGAAALLGAVAGSMVTIVGLVFSLTLVTLSLASSQFGPRLLRNFIRDRITQLALGTFVAAFIYCLLVLRTIRRSDGSEFVPHLSVTIGVVFAIVAVGMLIYFIHHLASSIQADTLIARVSNDLSSVIDRLYPEKIGTGLPPPSAPQRPTGEAAPIVSAGDGYIQRVDADRLLAIAGKHDITVEVLRRPGHYVLEGAVIAQIWPVERASDEIRSGIDEAFTRGSVRTPMQDFEFVIHQLVEIAVRALSPGINDPFTAITCIDRLASGLARLACREIPSPDRFDEGGRLRVIAEPVRFPAAIDAAFNQIRQYGRTSAAVLIHLLEVIADLIEVVADEGNRAALRRHAEMIARAAGESVPEENDRRDVEERVHAVARAFSTPSTV